MNQKAPRFVNQELDRNQCNAEILLILFGLLTI